MNDNDMCRDICLARIDDGYDDRDDPHPSGGRVYIEIKPEIYVISKKTYQEGL